MEQAKDYLGLGIHSTQTGPRADIPDANVSVAGAPSGCQDIGLPGTPSYSLGRIRWGQQVQELDKDLQGSQGNPDQSYHPISP